MNTFKKIYLIAIILTVFSFGTLALVSTGNISIYGETGAIVYLLAASLVIGLFILSRIANIFGNRQNLFIGYFGAFATFVYMLLIIIEVILLRSNNYELIANIAKAVSFFTKVELLVLINVLIYEIPYVNSTHMKIQYVTSAIATLLCLISIFSGGNGSSSINSIIGGNSSSSYSSYSSLYDENTNETSEDIETFLSYACIALIIINPMLRVYWIDKDFYNARNIDDEGLIPRQLTVNDIGKVQVSQNNLDKPAVDPVAAQSILPVVADNQAPIMERPNEPRKIIPHQENDIISDIDDEFTEPVLNKKFMQQNNEQATIPGVDNTAPPTDPTNT